MLTSVRGITDRNGNTVTIVRSGSQVQQFVEPGGRALTFQYGGVGAPTITALTPNTGNAGASVTVSLTGTNMTGAALATDNPSILVRNVLTAPTSLTARFIR